MGVLGVLDTGVLLGITIETDAHHQECLQYAVTSERCLVPPASQAEFQYKEPEIRERLHDELTAHRQEVSREVHDENLSPSTIGWIQANLLDREMDTFRFLYAYYEQLRSQSRYDQLLKDQIIYDLEEMEFEVWDDAAADEGGLDSLVNEWSDPVPTYPELERDLLICEGDDPTVCLECHHIAIEHLDESTELATTNPRHFIDHVDGEPESREANILRLTSIASIEDLAWDGTV